MSASSSELFLYIVAMFHSTAWQQLGKVPSPLTGDVERNLDNARLFIDLLGMLEEKTRGNLTEEESKTLSQVLSTLRLNYVDESSKPAEKPEDKPEERKEEQN